MGYNLGVKLIKKWLVPLALLSIAAASTWAVFRPELFRVHDYTHAARVAEMGRALVDGQFPPRWSQNFGYGYGMPLYVFYAPLPYLVGAWLWLLGLPMDWVIKSLIILPTLGIAFATYYLARRWLPVVGALIASAAVVTAPYRAVNFFVRGAFSEGWGMTFFVVALLGLAMTFDKKKWGWLLFCLGITGMMLSHNITVVLSLVPLAGFFALLVVEDWLKERRSWKKWWKDTRQGILELIGSGLLALGLSAFYWIPAFTLKEATQLDTYILGDYFNFQLHFLYVRQFFDDFWRFGGSSWGPVDDITFFAGWGQLAGMVVSTGVGVWFLLKKKWQWLVGFGLAGLGGFGLFMSLQKSQLVWEAVDLLKYIQFPWRFLSVAIPFLALFSAWWTKAKLPKYVASIATVAVFGALLFNVRQFYPESYLEDFKAQYAYEAEDIRGGFSGILIDYIPTGFVDPSTVDEYPYGPAGSERCVFGYCTIETLHSSSHEVLFKVLAESEPESFALNRSYFPGWHAQVNGEDVDITIGENATMFIPIPVGESLVGFRFGRSPEMVVADSITLISGFVLLYLLVRPKGDNAKK